MPPPIAECPMSLFGGYDSELAPPDVPEGVSPGNQDVAYLPGSVFSRPGIHRIYPATVGNHTLLYQKKYVQPNGFPLNLLLYDDGNLYVEDPINAPGSLKIIGSTTPGYTARSVTAFGREYIALSDGLHGADIPLQYDGTFLDRVSQDGPAAPPNVVSFPLPSVSMAITGAPPVLTVSECDPANSSGGGGYFTSIDVFVTGHVAGIVSPGQQITIAGNSQSLCNGTWTVTAVYDGSSSLLVVSAYLPPSTTFGLGGTATVGAGVTMVRTNNVVSVKTASAHFMQPGYQVQITGMPAAVVGSSISSIVINNENAPGLATVTTSTAHGLIPGLFVAITGISGVSVGGGISAVIREGQIVTVTTTSAHGLTPGASVTLAGVTDTSFNATVFVQQVVSSTKFVFGQVDTDASSAGGTVTLNWPIPDTNTPTYFEVQAAPSATTFQVQVNYSDGTWNSGSVSYAWNGTFFIASVPTATSFTFQQYGPNASSTTIGTVTPFGQASPGKHQLRVMFLTRQGYLTAPSPPVTFIANGGQYLSITNIPTGPPNIVARVMAFTGADGEDFFYIATPAQINGQTVSTSTQVSDNVTPSVVLDFSDSTLFAATGINIPGNNLPNQVVLGPCLGNFAYADRLFWWGERNKIQNLLNMGFDGGYYPSISPLPLGWTVGGTGGVLATGGRFGFTWFITAPPGGTRAGQLNQSFFQDSYGIPIATANTKYRMRVWLLPNIADGGLTFSAEISSASTGFSSRATVFGNSMNVVGGWADVAFSAPMPSVIPSDLILSVYAISSTLSINLLVDEISIIYEDSPYIQFARGSYVNNPEAFDGVTGNIGPASDPNPVLNCFEIRDEMYMQTADRLHQTVDAGDAEPSTWDVRQVASDCGVLSAFATDTGEDWAVWASQSGLRGFAGGEPAKLSQEVQTLWEQINPAARQAVWVKNDPINRRMYVGVPTGTNTLPNLIYPMDYRENDLMSQIIAAAPVRISLAGRMISSDLGRKWSVWNLPMASCGTLHQNGKDTICFGRVNAGQSYYLDPAKLSDDDIGQIPWYYITYGFLNHDQEQAFNVGSMRKLYKTISMFVSGVGNITVTPLVDTLANLRPSRPLQLLQTNPAHDMAWGLNVSGERCFFKISGAPASGTDSSFNLQKLVVRMMKHPVSPGRCAI